MAHPDQTILVTGGSGYIAGFCIAALLERGYGVRATLRSLAREPELRATLATTGADLSRLTFTAADLNQDDGWAGAVAGVHAVLHVASPLPTSNPRDDDELVRPARDGALRVLRAARDAGIRRVVMTASTATIAYGHGSRKQPFTETDWSDETNRADTSAYERSKTIAERAARDWVGREGGGLELVTIHPGAVLGPVMGRDFSASIEIVKKLLEGALPGLPRFGWPLVDVRDIADIHLRALEKEGIGGERYLAAGPFWWMTDVARTLREKLGPAAKRVPTRTLPDWLIRLASIADPVVRGRLFELGKERPVTAAKAERELGWVPRPNSDAVVDTARSLIAHGIVKV